MIKKNTICDKCAYYTVVLKSGKKRGCVWTALNKVIEKRKTGDKISLKKNCPYYLEKLIIDGGINE